ncbi:C39 family peptidase [Methanosphaerula palustris]|uniref:Peptidase C39-like domain-containing protein n=1 Tax=Methanosphaerula palustris (strain ATCC BAA-1556 / DSM 19958 / E1-9c) TaxID=521011 RepID=B8GJB3_METPE|nr:C39 family peptidase [Methanosphaerula palustris]ACL16954.1 hypothetical protein Mpal_1642 [Methanosphaerula palustris E1-9c]
MKLISMSIVVVALLLAAMVMVPFVTAAAADSHAVSVEEAKSVAETNVQRIAASSSEFSDWKSADIRQATTYYDLTGNQSAYSFELTVGGTYAGYLIISATRENFPVLEYSRGETPDRNATVKARADRLAAQEASEKKVSISAGRPLYLGATFFYMDYSNDKADAKKTGDERIVVDLNEGKILRPESSNATLARFGTNELEIQRSELSKKAQALAAWDTIEKSTSNSSARTAGANSVAVMTLGQTTKIIDDVPFYFWNDGCSPTSAAMVLGYWRNRGLTRLPITNQTSGDPLTSELRRDMLTLYGATIPAMIPIGMNLVTQNYSYQYSADFQTIIISTWHVLINEIDADSPAVLSMLSGGAPLEIPSRPYGEHSVAAVGYDSDGTLGNTYVIVHDTWDPLVNRHILICNWIAAVSSAERPNSTYTITASAGNHGSINPAGSVQVPIETRKTFTITPDAGCTITSVMVDGQSVGTVSSYTFEDVTASHTISATFGQNAMIWNWSQSGWGTWQYRAYTPSGLSTPYGPVMTSNSIEGLHGEYGIDIQSNPGFGQTWINRTFTDPTGVGWNTITFNGVLTPATYADETGFGIRVNNDCVFDAWASQTPPGNSGQPFSFTANFAQSPTVEVTINFISDYAPIERDALHYDSLSLSRQPGSLMTAGNASFTISDRNGTTQSGLITTEKSGTITITDSTGRTRSVTPLNLKNRSMTGAVHQSHE